MLLGPSVYFYMNIYEYLHIVCDQVGYLGWLNLTDY